MRITKISNNHSNQNYFNSEKKANKVTRPTDYGDFKSSVFPPAAYFLSFKGYKEDEHVLTEMNKMLDDSLKKVASTLNEKFYERFDNEFFNALSVIEEDKDLYSEVTKDSEFFAKIENEFEKFEKLTLSSMDDVRFSKKRYSSYWEKNSKTGNNLTADIIRDTVNAPNERINKIIKKSDDTTYQNIKNELIKKWFDSTVKALSEKKHGSTINDNLLKLTELTDENYAKTFFNNEKINLYKTFNSRTAEKILSPSTSEDEKINAWQILLQYVEAKLLEDKDENLKKDYDAIYSAENDLAIAQEKESTAYARSAIKTLHNLGFKQWEKTGFLNTINTKLEKEIITKTEEKENKKLHYFQNYPNFDTDTKYFVARYYNARYLVNNIYDYDDMDYLLQIINDRHNTKTPQEVIRGIGAALNENKKVYFTQLDNFYDLVLARKYNPEINLPLRKVQTPNDKMSFADLYLEKLGKTDNFKRCSEEEKLLYISGLTRDEITLLNNEIKSEWYSKDEKYAILDEVSRQAKNTSVFLGMYEELKKINLNIDEIKIITKDKALTLRNVLEDRTVLFSGIREESGIKLSSRIAEMQREYERATPQQQSAMDKNLSDTLPALIKLLTEGQKDSGLNTQLKELSNVSKGKSSLNNTLNFVKNVLIARTVTGGFSSSKNYLANHLLNEKILNPAMPDLSPIDTISEAGGIAGAGLLSQLGPVISANPAAAAVIATVLVSVGGAIIAANKASKAENSQRTLDFIVEI